ncbi:hypothetical protein BDZ97DRAFT_1920795 [Flammula alnicola]|nr:hypothetical protein BDZ97DRAFT_1920795 [Flammula alnicola]
MHSSRLLSFVLASLLAIPSLGITLTNPSQLTTLTYDYVIIGAGNAGLVIANRLTENANVTVLVLEAGVSDQGVIAAEAPFLGPTLTPNTPYDWNYTVVAQAGMDGRTFPYPRGRLLGGSSSANYLFHQYGTFEDWNRLANISGDSGWEWSNMKPYIQKHEKFVPPVDGHNTTGQFIPSLHGFNGEVSVSLYGYNQQSIRAYSPLRNSWQSSHTTRTRAAVTISSRYRVPPIFGCRPNLTVLINATVMKLLQTGTTSTGLKSFRNVQFISSQGLAPSPSATPITVTANKERHLNALNISTTIDHPSVGENLSDHTLLPNIYSVQGNLSFDNILRDPTATLDQWIQNKTGLFANNVVNNFGFLRIPANATIFQTTPDPAAGPNSPHWEIIIANFWFNPGIPQPATGSFMTVVSVLISPTSRGTIKLASTNPFDKPVINPQYLTTDFDIFAMRESVQAINRFVGAPAWSDYVVGPFGSSFAAATDDSSIDSYVRGLTTTIFHPVGTAAMSPAGATTGVVNPDLTVKGADGLRIVDASIFPFVPSCHTQGPVYLLAERASDIIKAADA